MTRQRNDRELFARLAAYDAAEYYPFHMPGHKRNRSLFPEVNLLASDITEITGFDDLHHPEGIFLELRKRAAALFHAEETFPQVNGSTGALLTALSACLRRGGRVLTARNCHKAVFHAIELTGAEPVWLYPAQDRHGICGSICPQDVEDALTRCEKENRPVSVVCLVSPTYEGVVSDIAKISETAHAHGVPLIVDEAHGAHLGFHPYFPAGALTCGADLVIQSLHKTMPSLTQTALLHVQGQLVDRGRLEHFDQVYQSSSPSYLLTGSIDHCVRLLEDEGEALFEAYAKRLIKCREALGACESAELLGKEPEFFAIDPGKLLLLSVPGGPDGLTLSAFLREKHRLETELAFSGGVLAMTAPADTDAGFERLLSALADVKKNCPVSRVLAKTARQASWGAVLPAETVLLPCDAAEKTGTVCSLEEAAGRISGDYIGVYPPGIPILIPGERITADKTELIRNYLSCGIRPAGMTTDGEIAVLAEE